jgi:cytochrome c
MIRVTLLLLLLSAANAWSQVQHGAPIRALAVLANGDVVSAGLDSAIFVWHGDQPLVLRANEGAVNALATDPSGAFFSGGADGRIVAWEPGTYVPHVLPQSHAGPISALATNRILLASASWDGTVRVWLTPVDGQEMPGHAGPVTAVAVAPDDPLMFTASSDGRLRRLGREIEVMAQPPTPTNALAVVGDRLAAAGADGVLRLFALDGTPRAEIELAAGPLVGLAVHNSLLAVASLSGTAIVVDAATARIVSVANTGEAAIWAVAFTADGTLLTGGTGRSVRRWDAATGRSLGSIGPGPVTPAAVGDRGAQVFRACAVCHALTPDAGTRAGPSLHALFGRPIGSLPGYGFSRALRERGGVWTPEALSALFADGPQAFAPGTSMPEQILGDPDGRAALARFLEQAGK